MGNSYNIKNQKKKKKYLEEHVLNENHLFLFGSQQYQHKGKSKTRNYIIKFDGDKEHWEEVKLLRNQAIKFYQYAAALQINHEWIVISGGYKHNKHTARLVSMGRVYLYNMTRKLFYRVADLQLPRYYHTMVNIKGQLFVLGGICEDQSLTASKSLNQLVQHQGQEVTCSRQVLNSVEVIDIKGLLAWCNAMTIPYAIQSTNCKTFGQAHSKVNESMYNDFHHTPQPTPDLRHTPQPTPDTPLLSELKKDTPQEQHWKEVCVMKVARYGHGQFVYKSKVYVFGGLDQNNGFIRQMERYHLDNNQWELLSFKFPFKVYSMGMAMNGSDLLIVGGRNQNGLLPTIYQVDFINRRYRSRGSFSYRFRPKVQLKQYFVKNQLKQMIYIFGGDKAKSCERLNPLTFQSFGSEDSYSNIIDHELSSFADAQFTMNLDWAQQIYEPYMKIVEKKKYKNSKRIIQKPYFDPKQLSDYLEGHSQEVNQNLYLFGNYQFPFVLEVNLGQNLVNIFEVGLDLKLYQFSVCVRIDSCLAISLGGTRPPLKKASRNCQVISLIDFHAKSLAKMNQGRCKFGHFYDPSRKCIYVLGGIGFHDDKQVVLSTVEVYSIQHDKWTSCQDMPLPLHSQGVCGFSQQQEIFVIGGITVDSQERQRTLSDIYIYDMAADSWNRFSLSLEEPLANFFCTVLNPFQKYILILGGDNENVKMSGLQVINLKDQKYKNNKKYLLESRVSPKGFVFEQSLVVFGGVDSDVGVELVVPSEKMIDNYIDFFQDTDGFIHSYKKYSFRILQNKFTSLDIAIGKYYKNKLLSGLQYC